MFTPTVTKAFSQFQPHVEKRLNPFEMAQRSRVPIAFVTAQQANRLVSGRRPPGPALFSPAWKAFADDGLCTASLMHWVQGQTGSSAHNHNGWPHPIPIAFPHKGEEAKDPVVHITVAETNLAEMEGEMEKGSPLILIWANNTAPALYNNMAIEKWFLDDRAAGPPSDSRQ